MEEGEQRLVALALRRADRRARARRAPASSPARRRARRGGQRSPAGSRPRARNSSACRCSSMRVAQVEPAQQRVAGQLGGARESRARRPPRSPRSARSLRARRCGSAQTQRWSGLSSRSKVDGTAPHHINVSTQRASAACFLGPWIVRRSHRCSGRRGHCRRHREAKPGSNATRSCRPSIPRRRRGRSWRCASPALAASTPCWPPAPPVGRSACDLGGLARVGLALVLAVGASEWLVRIVYREIPGAPDTSRSVPGGARRPHRLVVRSRTRAGSADGRASHTVRYEFDRYGDRAPCASWAEHPHAPTIVIAGESIAMGHGLPWPETFAARLGTACTRRWSSTWPVSGYGSDQAHLRAVDALARLAHPSRS